MNRPESLRLPIGIVLTILFLSACGTNAMIPSTATLTLEPPIPTSTSIPAAASPTSPPTTEAQEWDYVAIGESITVGMTHRYAKILEQDLGVAIVLHDWQFPNAHSSNLLEKLRSNEQLRQDLQEAEVITLNIPLGVIASAMRTYAFGEPGDCGGVDNQDCIQEAFSIYMTDTEEIIAEIVSLRRPSEALIRIMDTWQLKVRETKETGSFEMYNAYWREANDHIVEVATSYGIPVARIFDAFMGEDGVEDPRDLGLVGSDGLHPIQDGIDLMAEIFRNLGYDYAVDSP
jgi:hypothetical protein